MLNTPAICPRNHPFPSLLYGEWGLLALAILSTALPGLLPRAAAGSGVAIAPILGFGALGLWLPTRSMGLKLLHGGLQVGLILAAARLGVGDLRLFPLLYLVLVLRSCLMFQLGGRLLVTGLSLVLFVGGVQRRLQALDRELPGRLGRRLLPQLMGIRLNLIVTFVILLVVLLLLMNALLAERQRREELRLAHQQLQAAAAQIQALTQVQERTRIAREIHDALGHALTGLNIQLEGALKLWQSDPDQARQFLAQAKDMGSLALQETRQAVATLREVAPPSPSLASQLAPLLQRFQQITGVAPQITLVDVPLPPALQLTVYRILQEALTNICKHAGATQVAIAVTPTAAPPQLQITVEDNGGGFSPQDSAPGFGLKGMAERVAAAAGEFRLTSAPGAGCRVEIALPLPPEAR